MKKIHEGLTVIEYDKARNNSTQGGYKYLIRGKFLEGNTAFRTDKGFQDWLQRSNLRLQFIKTSATYGSEERTRIHVYETIGTIEENMFWKLEELPEIAIKYKGLCNGSVVDCYYIHTENGSKIYKPNPNAKEVYKPLQVDEHMEFIKNYG